MLDKTAAAGAGRLQKPLIKRIRRFLPEFFAQRGGKLGHARHARSDSVLKKGIADQADRRGRHQIERHADDQQEGDQYFGPYRVQRVNPCR